MSSLDKIRKERRDLAILIIAFGLVIGCVLYDLARAVYFQGISHPVASTLGHDIAPGGRVPFQHTSPIGIGLWGLSYFCPIWGERDSDATSGCRARVRP